MRITWNEYVNNETNLREMERKRTLIFILPNQKVTIEIPRAQGERIRLEEADDIYNRRM